MLNITKEVDYWVIGKRRKSVRDHIESVKIYKNVSESSKEAKMKNKDYIIKLIEKKHKIIYTCPKKPCKKENGAQIHVFPWRGEKYIRSNEDETARDNLNNVPNSKFL